MHERAPCQRSEGFTQQSEHGQERVCNNTTSQYTHTAPHERHARATRREPRILNFVCLQARRSTPCAKTSLPTSSIVRASCSFTPLPQTPMTVKCEAPRRVAHLAEKSKWLAKFGRLRIFEGADFLKVERGVPICSTGFGEAEPPPPPRPRDHLDPRADHAPPHQWRGRAAVHDRDGPLSAGWPSSSRAPHASTALWCPSCCRARRACKRGSAPHQSILYERGNSNLHRVFCSACTTCKSADPFATRHRLCHLDGALRGQRRAWSFCVTSSSFRGSPSPSSSSCSARGSIRPGRRASKPHRGGRSTKVCRAQTSALPCLAVYTPLLIATTRTELVMSNVVEPKSRGTHGATQGLNDQERRSGRAVP